MPFELQGFGTAVCSAAGDVYWGAEAHCDAVVCFVAFGIPVAPIKAVHVFDHKVDLGVASLVAGLFGQKYKQVPIVFRWQLYFRALFRRLSPVILVFGILLALIGYLGERMSDAWKIGLGATGVVLVGAMAVSFWRVWATDRRNKDIRYVLGRHEAGSSDPASWSEELLDKVTSPRELFATKTYGGAVADLVDDDKYSLAMWAARLCTALEDTDQGEQLTDDILDNSNVRAALDQIKSQAGGKSFRLTPAVSTDTLQLWERLMTGKKKSASRNKSK